ncbi:MAG: GvpL/GvpF family gas vesicle protein [Eubacteriales bacterium]
MSLIYIYCITKGITDNELITVTTAISGINRVEILHYKDIQAVSSLVDSQEFQSDAVNKHLDNLEWVEERAMAHENIIEEIMENYSVLPMRFLTIYENERNVAEFLKTHYGKIVKNLEVADNNFEFSIKVFLDKDKMKSSILESSDVKKKIEEITAKPKGIAYLLSKKLEDTIESQIQDSVNRDAKKIFERIEALSENIITKEINEEDVDSVELIVNAVVLANKIKFQDLKDEIEKINDKYGESGYFLQESRPWPIYNFIELI